MNVVCGLLVTYLICFSYIFLCLFFFCVVFFLCVCICFFFFFSEKVLAFLFVTLDLDECRGNNNHCHQNAVCTNTLGSYKCQCATGYTGDGFSCSGKETWHFFYIFFSCKEKTRSCHELYLDSLALEMSCSLPDEL